MYVKQGKPRAPPATGVGASYDNNYNVNLISVFLPVYKKTIIWAIDDPDIAYEGKPFENAAEHWDVELHKTDDPLFFDALDIFFSEVTLLRTNAAFADNRKD